MDCPELRKGYLHAITLSQTFNDEFTFIYLNKDYILCSAKLSEHCQFDNLQVVQVRHWFSIIDALHDPVCKFNYISTIGGIIINRKIQRRLERKSYKDTMYSLFSFFMVLFCRSFGNELNFDTIFARNVESVNGVGRVSYDSRFDVCGDGHIRCMLAYRASTVRKHDLLDGTKVMDVYRSPILDVDIDKESNGYHPGVKGFHAEYAMYRTIRNSMVCEYEDRGVKHLNECHHGCNDSMFCSICKRTLYGEN